MCGAGLLHYVYNAACTPVSLVQVRYRPGVADT